MNPIHLSVQFKSTKQRAPNRSTTLWVDRPIGRLPEQKRFGAGKLILSNNVRDWRYDRVVFCTVWKGFVYSERYQIEIRFILVTT